MYAYVVSYIMTLFKEEKETQRVEQTDESIPFSHIITMAIQLAFSSLTTYIYYIIFALLSYGYFSEIRRRKIKSKNILKTIIRNTVFSLESAQ